VAKPGGKDVPEFGEACASQLLKPGFVDLHADQFKEMTHLLAQVKCLQDEPASNELLLQEEDEELIALRDDLQSSTSMKKSTTSI
jgi:alpha-D-ribose 1-methylphosphonate 5-triphosphate diphosphatase PhnM